MRTGLNKTRLACACMANLMLFAAAGCSDEKTDSSLIATESPSTEADELDRCALLTGAEIEQAIGSHNGGSTALDNQWGLQSCRWTSTRDQKVEGYPDGWFEAIEVAVFEEVAESWARGEADGEAVAGFVKGASYDHTWGELWFDCAGDRFCVVNARTASGDRRAQIALQLARLVEGRLR